MTDAALELEKAKVNLETSLIPWRDLQRFFAGGLTIAVSPALDLVEVACQFAADNRNMVKQWLEAGQIQPVGDAQALAWLTHELSVWAVVVKPWILVQEPDVELNRLDNDAPANNRR